MFMTKKKLSLHCTLPAVFLEGFPQVCHLPCSEASGEQSYLPHSPKHDCSLVALRNNVVSHGNACQQIKNYNYNTFINMKSVYY